MRDSWSRPHGLPILSMNAWHALGALSALAWEPLNQRKQLSGMFSCLGHQDSRAPEDHIVSQDSEPPINTVVETSKG
jgi:hypothetical protein